MPKIKREVVEDVPPDQLTDELHEWLGSRENDGCHLYDDKGNIIHDIKIWDVLKLRPDVVPVPLEGTYPIVKALIPEVGGMLCGIYDQEGRKQLVFFNCRHVEAVIHVGNVPVVDMKARRNLKR